MLPPVDHACAAYVCNVPDGTVPGWTISSCQDAGYSGARSCTDPYCTPWRPSIPGCGSQSYHALVQSDPYVPQPLPIISGDPMDIAGGKGCCCGSGSSSSGGGSGSSGGLGGAGVTTDSSAPSGSAAGCCGQGFSLFGIPWWILVLLIILIIKVKR